MSINEQVEGGISVDAGFRATLPVEKDSQSRVQERAATAGAWSDDLGQWGSADWELPGLGEPGPKCGEYYPEAVCDSCGEPTFSTHQCGRRTCPDCWTVWAHDGSVRAAERVQSFRYTLPDNHERQVAHVVVSPSEGSVMNERQFDQAKSKAADMAKEKGMRGFAVIPHPYRMTEEAKQQYRATDVDYGIWVWWREDMGSDMDLVYWSPHFHIIGFTTQNMDEGSGSDGWVYHFVRSFGRFEGIHDLESHGEVYGVFRYLLSHAGWPEESKKDAITWHGDLANSIFVKNATEEYQHQKPSEGVRSALRREIEEAVGVTSEDDEGDESGAQTEDTDDMGECPCDGCDGLLIDVFDVRLYLQHNQPPPEVQERMVAAYEWRMGERQAPPGLKRPTTEEEARETFEAIL